jgi:hypothetical protein
MKFVMRTLPILLLAAVVAILYTQRETVSPPLPPLAERASDIRALHAQRESINVQLDLLEHRHEVFLPRGIGSVAGDSMPDSNNAQPAAIHTN